MPLIIHNTNQASYIAKLQECNSKFVCYFFWVDRLKVEKSRTVHQNEVMTLFRFCVSACLFSPVRRQTKQNKTKQKTLFNYCIKKNKLGTVP